MMLTRAFDARMLRSSARARRPSTCNVTGEEAIASAFRVALEPGDMYFPTYRQQGLLIAIGWPIVDMMCQIFRTSRIRIKGGSCRALLGEGGGILHRLRQSRHPISAGGRLGDGFGDLGDTRIARAGSAKARQRKAISMPRWCSLPSIGRRSFSMSSTTNGRFPPIRASPAGRAPNSPPARMATAFPRCASTATIISRSMRSRYGRPSARAPIWARR